MACWLPPPWRSAPAVATTAGTAAAPPAPARPTSPPTAAPERPGPPSGNARGRPRTARRRPGEPETTAEARRGSGGGGGGERAAARGRLRRLGQRIEPAARQRPQDGRDGVQQLPAEADLAGPREGQDASRRTWPATTPAASRKAAEKAYEGCLAGLKKRQATRRARTGKRERASLRSRPSRSTWKLHLLPDSSLCRSVTARRFPDGGRCARRRLRRPSGSRHRSRCRWPGVPHGHLTELPDRAVALAHNARYQRVHRRVQRAIRPDRGGAGAHAHHRHLQEGVDGAVLVLAGAVRLVGHPYGRTRKQLAGVVGSLAARAGRGRAGAAHVVRRRSHRHVGLVDRRVAARRPSRRDSVSNQLAGRAVRVGGPDGERGELRAGGLQDGSSSGGPCNLFGAVHSS